MTYSISVWDGVSKRPVEAILEDSLTVATLGEIETQWGDLRRQGNFRLMQTGRSELVQHGHWQWDNRRKIVGIQEGKYSLFGIRIGSAWQGAMSIYTTATPAQLWPRWRKILQAATRLGQRPRVVYVDYIETAPWNYEPFTDPDPPRYRGIGGQLMAEAVRVSLLRGYQGRVGLYSLPTSESFYTKIGMTRLFVDRDPNSSTHTLRYYEFDASAAANFLARGMRIRQDSERSR